MKIKSNNLILKHMALGLGLLCISTRYYVICMQIFSFSFKDNCTFKGLGTYSLKVCCYNKVQVKGLIKFPSLVFAFCKVLVCFFFPLNKLVFQGESIIGPPKIVITSIVFLQLIFLVIYGHQILNFFACFKYI